MSSSTVTEITPHCVRRVDFLYVNQTDWLEHAGVKGNDRADRLAGRAEQPQQLGFGFCEDLKKR